MQVLRAAGATAGFDAQEMHLGSLLGRVKEAADGGRGPSEELTLPVALRTSRQTNGRPRGSCRVEEHRDGQKSLRMRTATPTHTDTPWCSHLYTHIQKPHEAS